MTQPTTKATNSCSLNKWRIIPIVVFFLITLAVLLSVYRLRTDPSAPSQISAASSRHSTKAGNTRSRAKELKSIWEEGRTNDRWIVVTDDQDTAFVCSLSDIAAELEWRMLVVGNNISCCRKTCMLLDDAKLKNLNYEILSVMESTAKVEARRNAGYLYAMQHGARHIFDAYPETYISAKIPLETFKREMLRQLQNVALNVALGVVSERPYVKRVQNPYAHFGRPDLWTEGFRRNNQRFIHNHIYRICEVRPPSIEKFLDIDEDYFDWAAPALTLPGSTVAPFSSKNTFYSIEAFWGLVLFPAGNSSHAPTIPPHLLRTLWNQAVLGDIAGSLKLSLANVSTLQRREKHRKNPADLREPDGLASFLLKWTCSTRSSLSCTRDLFQTMYQFHYISFRSLGLLQSWINDLQRSHYLEPPVIPRRRGQMNPCLGADGLYGVAFYPALPVKSISYEQLGRRNATLERYRKEEIRLDVSNRAHSESLVEIAAVESAPSSLPPAATLGRDLQGPSSSVYSETDEQKTAKEEPVVEVLSSSTFGAEGTHENPISSRHAKLYDSHGTIEMPIVREFTDNACPGYSQLLPHVPENPFNNILLIVAMTAMRYEMIPMFEVVYREHFRNILYCGSPHDSIEIFLRKYQLSEDRSFSFLPIHSKYTYECLLGALEMGYNVDGWIMSTDDALINSWNIRNMNFSKLWYSGDYNIQVSGANWKTLDPGSQKLPRSLDGVQKVLEFLKSSLIGSVLIDDGGSIGSRGNHEHGQPRITKREAEISTAFSEKLLLEKTTAESRNNTDDLPRDEEPLGPTVHNPAQNIAAKPLDLHSNGGRLVFDVIELKSAANNPQLEQPKPEKLSSLNYVVDAALNATDAQIRVEPIQDDLITKVQDQNATATSDAVAPVDSEKSTSTLEVDQSFIDTNPGEAEKTADDVDKVQLGSEEDTTLTEGDEVSSESETERPVSEVLRKLLVATRNTTNTEQTELESSPETAKNSSAPSNSTIIIITENPENLTVASPLDIEIKIITEEIIPLEKVEEGEWIKPAGSGARENPIIDLFLHPVNSTPEQSEPQEKPREEVVAVDDSGVLFSVNNKEDNKEASNVKPEVGHDRPEVVVHEVKIVSAIANETSIPPLVEEHKAPVIEIVISNSTTTANPKTTTESSTSTPAEEERKNADTLHIEEILSNLMELYSSIKENLGVRLDDTDPSSYVDTAFYGGDRGYRLNPKSIHQFRCEKGTNLEFCKVSSEFLYQLSDNVGKDFRLIYDKVPMYYIPKKDQLKFYLLSNLMMQHGVTDEIAIPLILSGLGPEKEWVKLEKSYFGGLKGRNGEAAASNKYPLFNSAAAVLYPTDLNTVTTDPKLQKIFCLKYLLRLLQL